LPSELSATPDSFVRALAGAGVDLQVAAVTLLQEEMRFNGGGETAALMHQIALIFAAGSQRVLHMRNMFRPSE
jgi:hypothetical protein